MGGSVIKMPNFELSPCPSLKKDGVNLGEINLISWVVSGPLLSFPYKGKKGKRGCSGRVQKGRKMEKFLLPWRLWGKAPNHLP